MAGLMDLFGGGAADVYGDLISPEQRQALQRQQMMNTGLAILMGSTGQAGGPMPSLAQAVGGGYMAGQKGYQQGLEGIVQGQLTKAKLAQMKLEQERALAWKAFIMGGGAGNAPSMPAPVGPISPDASNAGEPPGTNYAGAPMPTVGAPRTGSVGSILSQLDPTQRAALGVMDPEAGAKTLLDESLRRDSYRTLTDAERKQLGLPAGVAYKINTRTNNVEVIAREEREKGPFGTGPEGGAMNILSIGSANTPEGEAMRATPEYALAWWQAQQPKYVQQIDPNTGNTYTVKVDAQPLPKNIARPTYKLSTGEQPYAGAPGATTGPAAAPSGPQAAGPGGVMSSNPSLPNNEEWKKFRESETTLQSFQNLLQRLKDDVRTNGMQIGAVGEAGGRQSALYKAVLLKLKSEPLANLGVLTGPDLQVLSEQIGDPTKISTYIKGLGGPDYFLAQLDTLAQQYVDELGLRRSKLPGAAQNAPKKNPRYNPTTQKIEQ